MDRASLGPLWLSVQVAACATVVVVALGLPVSLALARLRFPGKRLVGGLVMLPLVLPPTVVGLVLLEVIGRRGLLGAWLESALGVVLVFHWSGAVVAAAVTAFPLFVLPARSAFESVDPGLEEVARLLGRRELAVFRLVTLPLAWRGIAAGAVLAFVRALGDFGATLMVAGDIPDRTRTASLAIYAGAMTGQTRPALVLAAILAGLGIAALAVAQAAAPVPREARP
jgi:molybdate transport system permease protein